MIVITGASSGLGASLTRYYGAKGQQITICGRNKERLQRVVQSSGDNVLAEVVRLDDATEVESFFESLNHAPKTIIHCAGSGLFGPLPNQSEDDLKQLINNNVLSAMLVLQQAVKRYADHDIQVVVVMSTAAQVAKAGEASYCAVKWAVKGLLESLRLELKGKPMKLIGVYPGGMATEFWQTSGADLDTSSFMSADEAAEMIATAIQQTKHGYVSDITVNRL